jgi:hypothetical protein
MSKLEARNMFRNDFSQQSRPCLLEALFYYIIGQLDELWTVAAQWQEDSAL